jgi:Tfp pilus assembly protein PilV
MVPPVPRIRARRSAAGLGLVEVTIAIAVLVTGLMATARALASSITAVNEAQRTNRAAMFLETVMEDVVAQPYANLLALDGNQLTDATTADTSNFRVGMTVFQAAADLIQVDAVLTDLRSGREVGRVTTLRARR